MSHQSPLPGMPQMPEVSSGHGSSARGDGDDAVVRAWTALFDAFLALGEVGVTPKEALVVLRGYADDWPF